MFPEVVDLALRFGTVNLGEVKLASDSFAIQEHIDDQSLFFEKYCPRDGFGSHAFVHNVCEVADSRYFFIVKLEPRIKLLRIKIRPVVPSIVHYDSSENVGGIAGFVGGLAHFVDAA